MDIRGFFIFYWVRHIKRNFNMLYGLSNIFHKLRNNKQTVFLVMTPFPYSRAVNWLLVWNWKFNLMRGIWDLPLISSPQSQCSVGVQMISVKVNTLYKHQCSVIDTNKLTYHRTQREVVNKSKCSTWTWWTTLCSFLCSPPWFGIPWDTFLVFRGTQGNHILSPGPLKSYRVGWFKILVLALVPLELIGIWVWLGWAGLGLGTGLTIMSFDHFWFKYPEQVQWHWFNHIPLL